MDLSTAETLAGLHSVKQPSLISLNLKGARNMTTTFSYEDQILNQRERESDDCAGCQFAGVNTCRNQCHEVTAIYNKNLTPERS